MGPDPRDTKGRNAYKRQDSSEADLLPKQLQRIREQKGFRRGRGKGGKSWIVDLVMQYQVRIRERERSGELHEENKFMESVRDNRLSSSCLT